MSVKDSVEAPASNDEQASSGKENDTPTPDAPKTVSFEEFDKVQRANNWAQSQVREAQTKISQLESKLEEIGKGKPKADGPKKEDYDAAVETISNLKAQIEELQQNQNQIAVKGAVREAFEKHLAPGAFEAFFRLEGENLTILTNEETGEAHIGHAKKPWLKADELVQEYKAKHGYMFASGARGGAGVPENRGVNGNWSGFPSDFNSWSKEQRKEYFNKNPDAKKEFARKGRL